MKFGKVLTYKNVDEAKKLIGKRVVASDTLFEAENYEKLYREALRRGGICLSKVVEGSPFPFRVSNGAAYQFIREVLPDKPEYEPYDLSDKKVRDSLRGRWYKWEGPDGTREEMVNRILFPLYTKKWEVNGRTVEDFLKHCHWIDDGTPCGRRMDKEMSSPVLTRDGEEASHDKN